MSQSKMVIAMKLAITVVALVMGDSNHSWAKEELAAETQSGLAMWQSYKYGMFIHFGMATFTGRADENDPRNAAEPSTVYAPSDLDVDQWIRVARDAGMKYAVLTAKHTAGHCLWDSKVSFRGKEFDYDVATSGNQTDVVAAFVKACKKYGIAPGLYWCPLDFHSNSVPPGPQWHAGKLPDDFYQLAQDQFAELIQNYPDVGYYWIDVPRSASELQRQTIYALIKRMRPAALVLFNCHANTIASCQQGNGWPTDILNTERTPFAVGQFNAEQRWQNQTYHFGYEHCDCLAQHWFWYQGDKPRPTSELYRLYRRVIAVGGNLLLDVAPDPTGHIPESSMKALMDLKKAIDIPSPIMLNAKVTASNYYRNDARYRPEMAVDHDHDTRWATDDGTTLAWLAVDFGKPVTVDRSVMEQAYPELKRVKKFAIESWQRDRWKVCYQGENLGDILDVTFTPITASQFRLHIIDATDGPTIWEFQLFRSGAK